MRKRQGMARRVANAALAVAVSVGMTGMLVGPVQLARADEAASDPLPEGLSITGGAAGTDYTVSGNVVTINTGTELTLSGGTESSPIDARINVPEGTTANLVFDGLSLHPATGIALDIADKAGIVVTLADGTENLLEANGSYGNYWPAIHCTTGSKLTIDDSVRNVDARTGEHLVPTGGVIPFDCEVRVGAQTRELKKGSPASGMDSGNPGKLTAKSGGNAAVIGGIIWEDGGTMDFDGGIIEARNNVEGYGDGNGTAAIIGGGPAASGTGVDDMISFNGAHVIAQANSHGAAIGGGINYKDYNAWNLGTERYRTSHSGGSGNLTFNAGYITATAGGHGNAIGKGCPPQGGAIAGPCDSSDFTIKVTGGTVDALGTAGGSYNLGGSTRLDNSNHWSTSKIVVSGGSLYLQQGAHGFDGNAYANEADAEAGDTSKQVLMTKIDLSGYDNLVDNKIYDMTMSVDGVPKDYGIPYSLHSDKCLYLWLPGSDAGSEARVHLDIHGADGQSMRLEDFYARVETSGQLLKQYSPFDTVKSSDSSAPQLSKVYNGEPFGESDMDVFKRALLDNGGIPVQNPSGGTLTDPLAMTIRGQLVNPDTGAALSGAAIGDMNAQSGVGSYRLEITSTQYSSQSGFSNSFWGHRGYYEYAEILPAAATVGVSASRAAGTSVGADVPVTLTATVAPVAAAAKSCKAPQGYVQFYVTANGAKRKLGAPVKLATVQDPADSSKTATNDDGHEYSTATLQWTPASDGGSLVGDDGESIITAEYVGGEGANYGPASEDQNAVEGEASSVASESSAVSSTDNAKEDIQQAPVTVTKVEQGAGAGGQAATPIAVAEKGAGGATNIPVLADNSENAPAEKTYGDSFQLELTGGDTTEAPTYVSSDPNVATVDAGGAVHVIGVGPFSITCTRPGNGAFNPASKQVFFNAAKKGLSVTLNSGAVKDKPFDGTDTAQVDLSKVKVEGLSDADKARLQVTAKFSDTDQGTGKTVTVTVTLPDDLAQHYSFAGGASTSSLTTTGAITAPAPELTDSDGKTISNGGILPKSYGDAFTITASGPGAAGGSMSFESSNPNVVMVDSNGNVTVKGVGSATITVTAPNGSVQTVNIVSGERVLVPSGVAIADKTADGTTKAEVDLSALKLSGLLPDDEALVASGVTASAAFPAAGAGSYEVPVTLTLTGALAEKYRFTNEDGTEVDSATITATARITDPRRPSRGADSADEPGLAPSPADPGSDSTPVPQPKPAADPDSKNGSTTGQTSKPAAGRKANTKAAQEKPAGVLLPKVVARGKSSQRLTWTRVVGADGYDVYSAKCNVHRHSYQRLGSVRASAKRVWTRQGLEPGVKYKYRVVAWKKKGGAKHVLRRSLTVHSIAGGVSGDLANTKAVKGLPGLLSLKKGAGRELTGVRIVSARPGKRPLWQKHAAKVRYVVFDKRVATVNPTGAVKAKRSGKTRVWALAPNGVRASMLVTVR